MTILRKQATALPNARLLRSSSVDAKAMELAATHASLRLDSRLEEHVNDRLDVSAVIAAATARAALAGAVHIRRAQPKDTRTLARMASALFEHSVSCARDPFTRSHIPQNLVDIAKWFRALCRDEAAMVLVAESAGQVVGFLKGHRQGPYVAASGIAEVGYLSMLWVDPRARRCGVGRLLVRQAEMSFRAQGLRHIELHYLHDNDTAAAAWARYGYRPYRVASFKTLGD